MSSKYDAAVNTRVDRQKTSKLPLILSISVVAALVASYFIFPEYKASIDEAWEVLTSDDEERIAGVHKRDYLADYLMNF